MYDIDITDWTPMTIKKAYFYISFCHCLCLSFITNIPQDSSYKKIEIMSNPQKFYLKHMYKETGFRAAWDPGSPLEIGMIGKLDSKGAFTVWSTLAKQGIEPEILLDKSKSSIDYSSQNGISIEAKAEGKVPSVGGLLGETEAGFDIAFTSGQGLIFKATGYRTDKIVNIEDLQAAILEKYENGVWQKDYLIITGLATAATATIIISTGSTGKLALKAKTGISAQNLVLTDANISLTASREEGSIYRYIAKKGLTPLYSVMGVRHPWFGHPTLKVRGENEDELKALPFNPDEIPD